MTSNEHDNHQCTRLMIPIADSEIAHKTAQHGTEEKKNVRIITVHDLCCTTTEKHALKQQASKQIQPKIEICPQIILC